MATSLEISKRGPDRSSAPKTLSFGEKIVKIGPVDPEIIVLQAIIKKKEKKKLTQAKYIARSASLLSTNFLSRISQALFNRNRSPQNYA